MAHNQFAKILCFVAWFATASIVHAQESSPSLENAIEDISLGGKAFDKSPVPKSSVAEVNLQVQWRLWKKVRTTGQSGGDELLALDHDGRSLGYMNQPGYALAVTAVALGEKDMESARLLFKRAQSLSPNLPYPFLAEAAYFAPKEPGKFPEWGKKVVRGLRNGAEWPDTSVPWLLKLMIFGLIAMAFSSLIFITGQLLRNLPVVAYDATRIMPRGFSSNQTAIIMIAVVVVPGIIMRSPLVSALLMLAFVALVQNWREKVISVLAFSTLLLLPTINELAYDFASYFGSKTQMIARAQYVGCDAGCRETVAGMLEKTPDDEVLRYTALIAGYRTGERAALDRIVEETESGWSEGIEGYVNNLRGATLVALAKPEKAADVLGDAAIKIPNSAAPRFNLMRAYQMQDKLDDAGAALEAAVQTDLATVSQYLTYQRRDVNSFLIVEPLPLGMLSNYHVATLPEDATSAVESVWKSIAGPTLELAHAPMIGGMGILFVLLGIPLRLRGKSSTPCPKCGMARDPNDSVKTSNHQYCLSCYRTFVTGAGMNYEARVHNERVLGRRELAQKIGRRGLSLLIPGAGHHLAGRAITGFILAFVIGFSAMVILRPYGIVRPPFELFTDNWAVQVSVAWIGISISGCIILYAAIRDIAPVNE